MRKKMCEGREKYRWKIMLCICLLTVGIVISGTTCMAADTGSIRIEYHGRTEQDEEIILENAGFALYYVGNMQDGTWKTAGDFQNAGVSLEAEGSSERNKQADQLYAYVLKKKIQGSVQSTNVRGVAEFANLKTGLYLVAQTEDWKKSGVGTFRSAPFLVSVPDTIDGVLTWNVLSKPKSEWVPHEEKEPVKPKTPDKDAEPDKPDDKVKTEDSMPIELLLIVLISSVCLIVILWKKKKRSEENK